MKLDLGFKLSPAHHLPVIYQSEASECSLACLAMMARYYRYDIDLYHIRKKINVTLNGLTLAGVNSVAMDLGFNSRAIRLDIDEFAEVKLPIILHWDFNHYVVLKSIQGDKFTIHDPADGLIELSKAEFSKKFTGVALELWPSSTFEEKKERQKVSLGSLIGTVAGLKGIVARILLVALALELLSLVVPLFGQWVIDNVIPSSDRGLLLILSAGFVIVCLMVGTVKAIRDWYILHASIHISLQWSVNLYRKLLSLPIDFFEKRNAGDVVSKFRSFRSIQETISGALLGALFDGVMAIGMLILMVVYSPSLTLITVLATLLYIAIRIALISPLKQATEKFIVTSANSDNHFLETIRGVRSIKMNGMGDARKSSWFNLAVDMANAEANSKKLHILYDLVNGLIFGVQAVLVVAIGAQLVMNQSLSIGMLIAYIAFSSQFISRLASFVDMVVSMKMLGVHCERLADIALNESEEYQDIDKVDRHIDSYSIAVRNLSFKYSEKDEPILSGINFDVAEGESVAIIGQSGCGKTTLLKILTGILKPTSGQIVFGDVDSSKVKLKQLRGLVAVVMQDDQLLSGSIKDNIVMFSAQHDGERLIEVCQLAGIHSQILKMPMQYYTLVGDMGTTLSGGQKQRILLARALYQQPKFLFLDEATSHLDVDSEQCVNESIKRMRITRLIIAHRPETIRSADRVIDLSRINEAFSKASSHV
ncbi:peptidase domain-containing ABC transporter [Jeongeupia naejangsanensis]|uniref:Peptidase domain-containing ABC transporter n=1 Tax=Jeongeupia naejangsanensis TaxID=613195 RepID=A0ABS2BNQ9_9NEIS|nr:peptidase domain-containing ABC transporter [Jeongeupia naejangsanensis]MBM3117050.1 peptidase domain-containing ABC transporter [Jeongeupia naejangsanensis]